MASYRWVAENGENFGFDLDRVFVAGDSAGGQLAFYTAAVNTSDELKLLYGVSDTGLNIKAIGLISGMFDMKTALTARFCHATSATIIKIRRIIRICSPRR